jgi:hypothetical protein
MNDFKKLVKIYDSEYYIQLVAEDDVYEYDQNSECFEEYLYEQDIKEICLFFNDVFDLNTKISKKELIKVT